MRQPGNFRLQHIGFVFQFHHMVATMTLLENLEAPLVAMGLRLTERRKRAGDMLVQMNLSARANFLSAKVSGGERQRAAVARALINRPPLLLADEPTGNPEIARRADRCIALCDGRRVA